MNRAARIAIFGLVLTLTTFSGTAQEVASLDPASSSIPAFDPNSSAVPASARQD